MLHTIFQIILWLAVVILLFGSIDDLIVDIMYWVYRGNYKHKIKPVREYQDLPEKPIALMIGAWNESKVIGRTLSYILSNMKYENYKVFVGIYPNDTESVRIIKEYMNKSNKIIMSVNAVNGPSTKADNLNNIYSNIRTYEKKHGEFSLIGVFDAEDFIHPYTLKLQNYYINYQGYDCVQIPVTPIRSKISNFFHKTYCDMFAELHQKDMITKQEIDSYIPLTGTGMCFKRNVFQMLEKGVDTLNPISTYKMDDDTFGTIHSKSRPKLVYTTIAAAIIILIFAFSSSSPLDIQQTENKQDTVKVVNTEIQYPYYDGDNLFVKYDNKISVQVYSFNNKKLALKKYIELSKVIKNKYPILLKDVNNMLKLSIGEFKTIDETKQHLKEIRKYIDE